MIDWQVEGLTSDSLRVKLIYKYLQSVKSGIEQIKLVFNDPAFFYANVNGIKKTLQTTVLLRERIVSISINEEEPSRV